MGLIELIIGIAILGFIVWAVTTLIPMDERFKKAIYVVAVLILILLVFQALGWSPRIPNVQLND